MIPGALRSGAQGSAGTEEKLKWWHIWKQVSTLCVAGALGKTKFFFHYILIRLTLNSPM